MMTVKEILSYSEALLPFGTHRSTEVVAVARWDHLAVARWDHLAASMSVMRTPASQHGAACVPHPPAH
jgi:hypothetical protein